MGITMSISAGLMRSLNEMTDRKFLAERRQEAKK
jgi:hypothetical protein